MNWLPEETDQPLPKSVKVGDIGCWYFSTRFSAVPSVKNFTVVEIVDKRAVKVKFDYEPYYERDFIYRVRAKSKWVPAGEEVKNFSRCNRILWGRHLPKPQSVPY
jgi:hypothetical protein